MDEIDRICRNNDIKYTLIGGSLIGAIRHGGFIPWDDDMDIAMLRSDYCKFQEACKRELNDKYGYQNRVILKETYVKEINQRNSIAKEGIWIDIFAFDRIPDNKSLRYIQNEKNRLYTRMLRIKRLGINMDNVSIKRAAGLIALKVIDMFVSEETLKKKQLYNQTRYNNDNTKDICSMSGSYGYQKETESRKLFDEFIMVDFEGHQYMCVKDYDTLLRNIYGDYMTLPPEDQRQPHHYSYVDLGVYDSIL